jgi:uncharacterized Fe-S cluster protein YjdI
MREIVKRYTKDGITVVWQPGLCVHSQVCFHGLPTVFDPRKRPWVDMDGAAAGAIAEQVRRCPSGALALAEPAPEAAAAPGTSAAEAAALPRITATANGPLQVRGDFEVVAPDGTVHRQPACALCRCGQSGNKPWCDGSHVRAGFVG